MKTQPLSFVSVRLALGVRRSQPAVALILADLIAFSGRARDRRSRGNAFRTYGRFA